MGRLYSKGLGSKNCKNRQARAPLSGFPIGRPNYLFVKFIIKFGISHVSYVFADVDRSVKRSDVLNLTFLKWEARKLIDGDICVNGSYI